MREIERRRSWRERECVCVRERDERERERGGRRDKIN